MSVLTFNWLNDDGEQNDEVCCVTLNRAHVITMNHDSHGWDVMIGIRDALDKLAELNGWEIHTVGESGI
jgi:hypothetical protein